MGRILASTSDESSGSSTRPTHVMPPSHPSCSPSRASDMKRSEAPPTKQRLPLFSFSPPGFSRASDGYSTDIWTSAYGGPVEPGGGSGSARWTRPVAPAAKAARTASACAWRFSSTGTVPTPSIAMASDISNYSAVTQPTLRLRAACGPICCGVEDLVATAALRAQNRARGCWLESTSHECTNLARTRAASLFWLVSLQTASSLWLRGRRRCLE